jgi:TRAP-type C4-dicarboxylate transport system permease large subunit
MVYMIIVAATLLNYFVFVSKLDERLVEFVQLLDLPGWAVMCAILVILTVMGCIFDVLALILLSIPVFLPVAVSVGYDPVWFGIVLIIAAELALITPPVGVNLFIIKSLAPEGTMSSVIARGALPYVMVVWVLFALLIAFPEIALWLPSALR